MPPTSKNRRKRRDTDASDTGTCERGNSKRAKAEEPVLAMPAPVEDNMTIRVVMAQPPPTDCCAAPVMSSEERKYLAQQKPERRLAIMNAMNETTLSARVPLRFRLIDAPGISSDTKADWLRRLQGATGSDKTSQLVEAALRLPLDVYDRMPVIRSMPDFLAATRAKLDEELFGQDALKDEVVRAVCSWASHPSAGGIALALEGPPGVGKTCVARALGRVTNRRTYTIPLGGLNDVSVLLGHSFTYESSTPGMLAECLMACGSSSPIIVFDEVDKIENTARAQEIIALLIHLTDPCSNHDIRDRYFQNLPLDFSRASFVFTMNHPDRVSPVLLDRLQRIRMQAPSKAEKVHIAQQFLIPREVARLGTTVDVSESTVREIVENYSASEPGVRGLARAIRRLVETYNLALRGGIETLRTIKLSGDKKITALTSDVVRSILGESQSTGRTGPTSMMYT